MAVAVMGEAAINFNRIISLSAPPYTVSDFLTKAVKDDSVPVKKIRGLFIIDIDNVIALEYDATN
jgi:hypothetical protein